MRTSASIASIEWADRLTVDARGLTEGKALEIRRVLRALNGGAEVVLREDEAAVYPRVAKFLGDRHGLGAMSRAHREIIHMARLLRRLAAGLTPADADHYLIRDAQRVIEGIEALVRIHNAQEEDIYEHAIGL